MNIHELLKSSDAAVWAKEFVRLKTENNWTLDDIDEALMLGWFANAMAAKEISDGISALETEGEKECNDEKKT